MRAYLVAHVFTSYCVVFGLILVITWCQLVDWLAWLVFSWFYRSLTTFKSEPRDGRQP